MLLSSSWACCDQKSRAACAQSFALWHQATIEVMLAISLTNAGSRYICNGVILHAHPVRGESHNYRNTTGEVATGPRPGKTNQNGQNTHSLITSLTKNPKTPTTFFFSLRTRRLAESFEWLISSSVQSVEKLRSWKGIQKLLVFSRYQYIKHRKPMC